MMDPNNELLERRGLNVKLAEMQKSPKTSLSLLMTSCSASRGHMTSRPADPRIT